jgi:hypothetical protein
MAASTKVFFVNRASTKVGRRVQVPVHVRRQSSSSS